MLRVRYRLAIGKLGALWLFRVRRYRESELLDTDRWAVLDPFFAACLDWGWSIRLAHFWPLVRSRYAYLRTHART